MDGRNKPTKRWPWSFSRALSLPRHSWEAHSRADKAEAHRTFLIILLSLVSVIILSLFLFFGAKIVGKAIALPAGSGGASEALALPKTAGQEVILPLAATLPAGKESVGYELVLQYDPAVLQFATITSRTPWSDDFLRVTMPTTNTVKIEHATLDYTATLQGAVELAEAQFRVQPGQQLTASNAASALRINSLTVFDLQPPNANLIQNVIQPTLAGQVQSATQNELLMEFTAPSTVLFSLQLLPGVSTTSVYLELTSPDIDVCAAVAPLAQRVTPKLWTDFQDLSCSNNRLVFGSSTLRDESKSGHFSVAEFSFTLPADLTTLHLQLEPIDVYDRTGKDIFPNARTFELAVPALAVAAPPEAPPSGGGGGRRCRSSWQCSTAWSWCNVTLQQWRECQDLNRCQPQQQRSVEVQSCAACEESWICSEWSSCFNGRQERECYDEHECGSYVRQPPLQQGCQVAMPPAPMPVYVAQPPPVALPIIQQPAPPTVPLWLKVWRDYKLYLIAIPSALAVIITLLSLIHHFRRPKGGTGGGYNLEELKGWVAKEKAMGTSDEHVKTILAHHTGWSKEEVEKVTGS